MGRVEWALLILLSLLWGGGFFFTAILVRVWQPFTVVFGRTAIAFGFLFLVLLRRGEGLPASWRTWRMLFVLGALNNLIPHGLTIWAQQVVPSGLASVLNAAGPLFSVLLAHFLTGEERLSPGRVAGVLLGFGGVAVLIGPDAWRGLGARGLAQLAIVGATLFYALGALYARRIRGLSSVALAAGMLGSTAVMSLPLAAILEKPWQVPATGAAWLVLVGLAILATALAYLLYFRVLTVAGATNALLVTFLIPVSALLLGVLFLGERVTWQLVAGMLLIFAGLAAVDGRLAGRLGAARLRPRRRAV